MTIILETFITHGYQFRGAQHHNFILTWSFDWKWGFSLVGGREKTCTGRPNSAPPVFADAGIGSVAKKVKKAAGRLCRSYCTLYIILYIVL
jgi:hypothetical protein